MKRLADIGGEEGIQANVRKRTRGKKQWKKMKKKKEEKLQNDPP